MTENELEMRLRALEAVVMELASAVEAKKPRKRFVVPTLDEVRAYCRERGNCVEPVQFWNFYQSKDWHVGKNKMVDWKAAVRTWEHKESPDTPKKITDRHDGWDHAQRNYSKSDMDTLLKRLRE